MSRSWSTYGDSKDAILDGEIVCLDAEGRSRFNPLLFRRRRPVFAVFDILWHDGGDLRQVPLVERKACLRALMPCLRGEGRRDERARRC